MITPTATTPTPPPTTPPTTPPTMAPTLEEDSAWMEEIVSQQLVHQHTVTEMVNSSS